MLIMSIYLGKQTVSQIKKKQNPLFQRELQIFEGK